MQRKGAQRKCNFCNKVANLHLQLFKTRVTHVQLLHLHVETRTPAVQQCTKVQSCTRAANGRPRIPEEEARGWRAGAQREGVSAARKCIFTCIYAETTTTTPTRSALCTCVHFMPFLTLCAAPSQTEDGLDYPNVRDSCRRTMPGACGRGQRASPPCRMDPCRDSLARAALQVTLGIRRPGTC